MNYKKGDYLKLNDGEYTMVRGVVDENAVVSRFWRKNDSDEEKAEQVAKANVWVSFEELDRYHTICTAEEAGIKWIPEEGEKYYTGIVTFRLKLDTLSYIWRNDSYHQALLSVSNVHRTEEEALTFMKSKMK